MDRAVGEEPMHEGALRGHHPGVLLVGLGFFLGLGEGSAIGTWWAAGSGYSGAMRWGVESGGFLEDAGLIGEGFGGC